MLDGFVEKLPQLQIAHEIRALVLKRQMRAVGGFGALERAITRILHRQRRRNNQHFRKAILLLRGDEHARDARINRKLRQLPTDIGELVFVIHRTQFGEQLVAVGNGAWRGRLQKRKVFHVADLQRLHAQNHRGQRRAQYLRVGKLIARSEIFFVVQPHAHARSHPPATARALVGGGARDFFDLQQLHLVAVAVAVNARETRINHVTNARHGKRGFCHVGSEHDAPVAMRLEHAILFLKRQAREQRQYLRATGMVLAQGFGGVAYLALAGQKNQDIARRAIPCEIVYGVEDGGFDIFVFLHVLLSSPFWRGAGGSGKGSFVPGFQRPIPHLYRKHAPGNLNHRCAVEVLRKALRIYGCGGHNHLQIQAARQQPFQITQQKINVQTTLVRLVNNERVVLAQQRITLRLGQQYAVGHELDIGVVRHLVGEAHLVAHGLPQRTIQLLRNACGHGARGNATRLRVADQAVNAALQLQTNFRQLRGLARTGFAADDDDLMLADGVQDIRTPGDHRQIIGVNRLRQVSQPRCTVNRHSGVHCAKSFYKGR